MQAKTFNELSHWYTRWDANKNQFYRVAGDRDLRVYEGGYYTFDADPDRDTGRTRWLWNHNCRVGTYEEIIALCEYNVTTPDGEPVKAADLSQAGQQVLLWDLDHRIAVALDGRWDIKRVKHGVRVYWPSAGARPISNWQITVSRADRKESNRLKKLRDDAADVLWGAMQMMGLHRRFAYGNSAGWDAEVERVFKGKTNGAELLEKYIGNPDQLVYVEGYLRNAETARRSRRVTQVDYLKF